MPSAPPISSTTTSISGSAAIAAASSYQRTADRSTPRSRRRSRAETAATTMRRPARSSQQLGLPVQQLQDAGADRAETGDGDLERRFHDGDPDAVCETQSRRERQRATGPL